MSLQYLFKANSLIAEGRTTKNNIEALKKSLPNDEETCVPKEIPDELIILFLLACDNNVEVTKKTIMSYFNLIRNSPEIFDNRNVEEMDSTSVSIWSCSSLPIRTKENYVINLFKLEDSDYTKLDFLSFYRLSLKLLDIAIDKENPPDGLIVIADASAIGLMHLTKFKLELSIKFFTFLQDALPIKLQSMHFINCNYVQSKVFNVIKSLIKNEVFNKMHLYPSSSMNKFFEQIPHEYLPEDYGGNLPCLKKLHEQTKQQIRNKQEFWIREEKLRKKYY